MTRRRFHAPSNAFAAGRVRLSAEETQHLRNVLRLEVGDEAFVFDGAGHEFRGEIAAISRDSAEIRIIQEVSPAAAESPLDLTIAVALLKGEKFDLVVQKLTELGVTRVVPITTTRADVRLRNGDDANRRLGRWRRIVMEATKQCGRARLLTIEAPATFNEFVLRSHGGGEMRLMFTERDGASLGDAFSQGTKARVVTALVGPEGGWTDDEIKQARVAGWTSMTLRGRIMRAETAAIACAALLQHRFGDLI